MFKLIWLSIGIIMIISMIVNNKTATKVNNSMILAVTLPYSELKNQEVLKIVDNYEKAYYKLLIIFSIIFLPSIFISYVSIEVSILIFWTGTLIYLNEKLFRKYNEKLKALKREKNWFIGGKHLISIDTEVSRVKDKMPVSKYYFIPSIVISLIIVLLAFVMRSKYNINIIIISLMPLMTTFIFMIIYSIYYKSPTKVYSSESQVNLLCNTIYKRYWTLGCVSAAFIQSLSMLVIFLMCIFSKINDTFFIAIFILPVVFIIVGISFINNKIITERNNIISRAKEPIFVDNDEYWNGDTYCNPSDRRAMVEKRVGYGLTYNMATTKGKLYCYGLSIFTILIITFVVIQMFAYDFTKLDVVIANNSVNIVAPSYGVQFEADEIEELKMVENIEVTFRSNGVGAETYSLGDFSVNNYGTSRLFVYSKDDSPYIYLKVNGKNIFIKGKTKEETDKYYNELKSLVN